jgi:hypothetical protein
MFSLFQFAAYWDVFATVRAAFFDPDEVQHQALDVRE